MKVTNSQKHQVFKAIQTEYGCVIKQTCIRYTHNKDDLADLLQDVWFNMWIGLDRLRNPDYLSTWTYRVTRNTAVNFLRKRSVKDCLLHNERSLYNLSDIEEETEADISYTEVKSTFILALQGLQEIDQLIVKNILDNHDYQEISRITGLSEINVRVRMHRSKKRIRQLMEDVNPSYKNLKWQMIY